MPWEIPSTTSNNVGGTTSSSMFSGATYLALCLGSTLSISSALKGTNGAWERHRCKTLFGQTSSTSGRIGIWPTWKQRHLLQWKSFCKWLGLWFSYIFHNSDSSKRFGLVLPEIHLPGSDSQLDDNVQNLFGGFPVCKCCKIILPIRVIKIKINKNKLLFGEYDCIYRVVYRVQTRKQ